MLFEINAITVATINSTIVATRVRLRVVLGSLDGTSASITLRTRRELPASRELSALLMIAETNAARNIVMISGWMDPRIKIAIRGMT